MLFIRFIRFCKGIVCFTLIGGFVERFLNLCTRAGLPVFNTERQGETLYACTTARSYKAMRPLAKKTGVRMRLHTKHGLPFLAGRYHRRVGLFAGMLLFVLFMCGMSQFIWNVELSGNEIIADEYLLQKLEECGVREGAYAGGIDAAAVEKRMLLEIPQLSWIAVNLRASSASVEVREREMPPEMIDTGTPCNVVAARTGHIILMEVYEGSPVVQVGDAVEEGDLIVSAYIEGERIKRGYMTHARAKVVAEFEESLEIRVPLKEEMRVPTGEAVRKHTLHLFGLDIPLYITGTPKAPSEKHSQRTQPIVLGLKLPFVVTTDIYELLDVGTVTLSESQAREEALAQLSDYEKSFATIGEIVQKTARGAIEDGAYIIHADFTLRQDIARLKAIEVAPSE